MPVAKVEYASGAQVVGPSLHLVPFIMDRKALRRRLAGHIRTASFEEVCAVLEAYGWQLLRVAGSHHLYGDAAGRRLSLPRRREVKAPYVRQVLALTQEDEDGN